MAGIVCNTRVLAKSMIGVSRYVTEILARAQGQIDHVTPKKHLTAVQGHVWEQFVLPTKTGKRLLWSPSQSGPLAVTHQVVTVHDGLIVDHPEWVGGRYGQWYRFMYPRLLPRVRQVIAVSEFTRDRILNHFPKTEGRISVVLNGVGDNFYRRDATSIDAAITATHLPSRHYILNVCYLVPHKNLKRLLRVWNSLVHTLPSDIWLVLAGEVGSTKVFGHRDMLSVPPRVHFTGRVSDEHLPALMSGALAFVYPSQYEGFGLPALEALACGTPCLTSSTTGIPEAVGDAALTVDPADDDALADGLLKLINDADLCADLRQKGLKRAAKLTWQRSAEQTLAVLQAAASAP